ncbi:MAG: phasin family protein [Pseudoramibacter sp.]
MASRFNFGDEFKKVLLAGVGAAAITAEKAEQVVDYCVQKGELTVEQGKVVNEELKHSVKEKVNATKEKFKKQTKFDDVLKAVDDLSDEELEALKNKLNKKEDEKAADVEEAEVVEDEEKEEDSKTE